MSPSSLHIPPMRKYKFLALLLCIGLTVSALISNPVYAGPIFTGNAQADFTAPDTFFLFDPSAPDVGVPAGFPPGTVSGWDVQTVYFDYDSGTDILYIGIDCFRICGDADGDGQPGVTSGPLATQSGQDNPDLRDSETFTLYIDTNNSGVFDAIIGKPPTSGSAITDFGAYLCSGTECGATDPFPSFAYGARLSNVVTFYATPSVARPDIELTVQGFSTLPMMPPIPANGNIPVRMRLFSGSFQDAGIGEDRVFGNVPLGVRLAAMDARAQSDHILLSWETSLETDNLGFNIYRSPDALLPSTPLNPELILAQAPGSGQGATYEWADYGTEPGATYYYWLEDVAGDGTRTLHDPVIITAYEPTAVTLSQLDAGSTGGSGLGWLLGAAGLTLLAAGRLRTRRTRDG